MRLKDITDNYEKANQISNTTQKVTKPKELVWNVIAEDWNTGIGYVNVFNYNWPFRAYVYRAYRDYKDDFDNFSKEVRSALMHEYWSRTEYEVVVTSWPCGINEQEVERLSKEVAKQKAEYPTGIHQRVYPKLERAVKIDIYDQVMMNWDLFINYLWENKKLISKFRKDHLMLKR